MLAPIVVAVYYSLYNWTGFGPLTDYVGLRQLPDRALSDPVFQHAIGHNLIIAGLSLVIQTAAEHRPGADVQPQDPRAGRCCASWSSRRTCVSEAITAVIWLLMLQPDGFVDQLFKAVGLRRFIHLWLADPHLVLYTLFVVLTWKYIGFGIILLLAGLQGIPAELREAAALDGATAWQTTRRVILPLLGPTIRIWIFLSMIGSLQLFDLVWIMTRGGPANASATMSTYQIDRGFGRYEFGYGSSVAVILFVICFVFALLYQRFALRRDTEGALTRGVA